MDMIVLPCHRSQMEPPPVREMHYIQLMKLRHLFPNTSNELYYQVGGKWSRRRLRLHRVYLLHIIALS